MKSFLITFKPATENAKRGWPLEKLLRLVRLHDEGKLAKEDWRFHNRKDASVGDRVFLLLQGKRGPAIIGYGKITGKPEYKGGTWQVAVEFESIVDPSRHILAAKDDLRAIDGGRRFWNTQASGVLLPDEIANVLERLVVDKSPKPYNKDADANPDWTRDELIVALNFYLQHRPNPPAKGSEQIRGLSATLNRLGEKLFPPEERASTFRNENGVYMKLMNFRRLDPEYTSGGRTGLVRGAKAEEEVWREFAHDPVRCRQIADAIEGGLENPEIDTGSLETQSEEGIEEAPEGRLLTRIHVGRERNRKLVQSKRKQALKKHGKLLCEICEFDFTVQYGSRGEGFMECHHLKPVATLVDGQKTRLDDLALVCANCHRMIHRSRPWLSIEQVKELLNDARLALRSKPAISQ